MKRQVKFPWSRVEVGQGFFVPCLDTAATVRKGLQEAIRHRVRAKATPGIRRGLLGVLFVRTR